MSALIINEAWDLILKDEFDKPYFKSLQNYISEERITNTVYPSQNEVYNALKLTAFKDVKVIIIGQDPYHGANQAQGLSFSVNNGVKIPPSLTNVFKELKSDIGQAIPSNGNLTNWAKQGVLLLNSTLTVREKEPGSHQKKGWEEFTDAIISLLSKQKLNCVFLLWGNFAKTKINLIDTVKHLVLEAAHPSPLARGAFFGCKHFSKTNIFLKSKQINEIDWNLASADLFTSNK
jgi:uracil-DNA glycosylase